MLAASLSVAFAQASSAAAASDQAAISSACRVDNEEAFRSEIDKLTFAAISKGLDGVDYRSLVDAAWRTTGVDTVLEQRVNKSIAEVQEESSWSSLLQSLASREAAQNLASTVAERTYRSEEMKGAVESVAGEVGKQLSSRIELATLDAAEPAVGCVRAFLGQRYGSAITKMVAGDTQKAFEKTVDAGSAQVTTTDLAIQSKGLIAGAIILVVRRSLSNLAKRIGQRVVGAVLGRLVLVAADGVGIVLIAKDIWEMRNGILPIIQAEMVSDDTKVKVKAEIATAFAEQLQTHLREVSAATADRILEVWHEFKTTHAKVVELADKMPEFKTFMDTVEPQQIPRVDRVVSLVLASEGEAGIAKRVADGTLDQAAKKLPEAVLDIATDSGSLEAALGWQRLAGDRIDKVAALEIDRIAKPQDFTADTLQRLIGLDDKFAVSRVGALPRTLRETLSELSPERQRSLARALTPEELSSFAGYVQGLKQNAAVRLASAVSDDPHRMKLLADPGLQQAILTSRDQDAAVGMMLREGDLFDILSLQHDFNLTTGGDVSPLLMWHKHTGAVAAVLAVAGLLLLMFLRLLFGGRRRTA